MTTLGDVLKAEADKATLPLRTLEQVKECLARDKKKKGQVDVKIARMMLRFGRLTDEARAYVLREYSELPL